MHARALTVLSMLVFAAGALVANTPAGAYGMNPAVPLEQLATSADLVCKAIVVSDRVVADPWFDKVASFETHETVLKIVSVLKGAKPRTFRFRHYAAGGQGFGNLTPPNISFAVGRAYLVFAAKQPGGTYRGLAKWPTSIVDPDAILAADLDPHHGKTITEAAWAELVGLVASPDPHDATYAIAKLDVLSGGSLMTKLKDFERPVALEAIRGAIASTDASVATAAIDVFGVDSPYYEDRDAGYWLAGLGKGTISGLGPRTLTASPAAALAVADLLAIADGGGAAELRGRAIRALGRIASVPAAKVLAWSGDPSTAIRSAATMISAERVDRTPITRGVADQAPEVRTAAALAIGFSQDPKLLPLLVPLLGDPSRTTHMAAAMSVLSFARDLAAPIMTKGLTSGYRSLFVNALAARDPKPYLPLLGEIIVKHEQPTDWWGGSIPAGDSWKILFAYVRSVPAAELAAGKLDASLDALERMRWFSSSEPRDLYALYRVRGLTTRAQQLRAATKDTLGLAYFYDQVDKNPAQFVP